MCAFVQIHPQFQALLIFLLCFPDLWTPLTAIWCRHDPCPLNYWSLFVVWWTSIDTAFIPNGTSMAVSLLQQQGNDMLYFKLNTGALSEPACVFKFNCMEQAVIVCDKYGHSHKNPLTVQMQQKWNDRHWYVGDVDGVEIIAQSCSLKYGYGKPSCHSKSLLHFTDLMRLTF